MKHKRRQLLIDRPVQVGLVTRVVFHWFTFLATVAIVLPMFRAIVMGDFATPFSVRLQQAGVEATILLVLFALLLPYFIYDTFRITNRFAGPMYRLQMTIRGLAQGAPFKPLKFRDGDYWHHVAADFNNMVERLQDRPEAEQEAETREEEALAV